jgi:hypothetical protein
MRRQVTEDRLARFMRELGRAVTESCRVYFTGGVTALLFGWRGSTIDIDLKLIPDSGELLRTLPRLKEELDLNIEIASPDDFIPELPGWQERSAFIQQEGPLTFLHYDFYAQALAKIERGYERDLSDVREMFASHLVTPNRLRELFNAIEPQLYRYPAISPAAFRQALEQTLADVSDSGS